MKKNKFLEKIIVDFLNDSIIPYYIEEELDISIFELIAIHYEAAYEKKLNETKDWPLILELWKTKIYIEQPIYSKEELQSITQTLDALNHIYQPEQRSEAWYEIRNNLLTASDLATALELNPYSKKKDLIFSKAHSIQSNIGHSPAIMHGVKFEDVAIHIYSDMNDVHVQEYGCIPHSTLTCFGASPDGICSATSKNKSYIGRMVEIKCPKSRPITGFIPVHYELQIQGQLEVCNLDYCDFLECAFQEYNTLEEFLSDTLTDYKGAIFEYYSISNKSNKYNYLYDCTELEKWQEDNIDMVLANEDLELTKITYWKCAHLSVVLVKRDKKRFRSYVPQITAFWQDVLKERDNPYEIIQKKTYKKGFSQEELTFLPDSN